jgi:hypothetical protein
MTAEVYAPDDVEDRAIQLRSFAALAWMAAFAACFAWLVFAYLREQRTVDCIQFVSAPNYAPPPGTCMRERTAFR